MKFTVHKPDYVLSPYTGMTRTHWLQAASFLMEGVFSGLKDKDTLPFVPAERNGTGNLLEAAHEAIESLSRSFTLATPLIREDERTEIHGICLRDYYADHILRMTDPDDSETAYTLEQSKEIAPSETKYPQTVECAMLAINLMETKSSIWDRYTKEEQDQIASYMSAFGHFTTASHNWRFFNILVLTFLKLQGYTVDEEILADHLHCIQDFYAGDGWYRDGNYFDYYNCWAFQLYAPIWNRWYGYRFEPEIAAAFEHNCKKLMETYRWFYGKEGESALWGRSCIYRFGASAPFASSQLLRGESTIPPGEARRIMSGNLLQFLAKESVFEQGIPCLGWYGPFAPMTQQYSTRMSVFWLAKAFINLSLPEDHPFWTEKETDPWTTLEPGSIHTVMLEKPGIKLINDTNTGTTELKTSKFFFPNDPGHFHYGYLGSYSRLSFNTAFPWEGLGPSANAMQYTLACKQYPGGKILHAIAFAGNRDDVLYRRGFWSFEVMRRDPFVDLADISVPYGTIRVDKIKMHRKPYTLTLGTYALPHQDGNVELQERRVDGHLALIAKSGDKQIALVAYHGWDDTQICHRTGTNAISGESTILYARNEKTKRYGREDLLVTVLLSKTDGKPFSEAELCPITHAEFLETAPSGSALAATLSLRDGRVLTVDFGYAEGILSC
jgi:hypothetical protein